MPEKERKENNCVCGHGVTEHSVDSGGTPTSCTNGHGGTGARGGVAVIRYGGTKCPCRKFEETYTPGDVEDVVDDLAMLRMFPSESRSAVIVLLSRMCPHKRALFWLRDEFINKIGVWHGPAELRGVLCNKFEPLDGVDAWSSLPGYTAEDGETRTLALHEITKTQELIGGFSDDLLSQDLKRLAATKLIGSAK